MKKEALTSNLFNKFLKIEEARNFTNYGRMFEKAKIFVEAGLSINPEHGLVYLRTQGREVKLDTTPAGLSYLVRQTGFSINCQLICEHDKWGGINLENCSVEHKILAFERGSIKGVYCQLIHHETKIKQIDYMPLSELQKVKSKSKGGIVYNDWAGEMYKKTVIKRAVKRAGVSSLALSQAIELDNENFDLSQKEEKRVNVILSDPLTNC